MSYNPDAWIRYLGAAMADAGIVDYADLARRTGLDKSVISRWHPQRGHHRKPRQPSTEAIRALSGALNKPARELLIESGHFIEVELPFDESRALDLILDSDVLTDRQKLHLIDLWRVAEHAMQAVQIEASRIMTEELRELRRPPTSSVEPV